ncbi:MAG: type II toxin-antitoxin system RelE/ParE family toxin [Candidatus Methylomirabilis sp.]|nr:type II toxin-antitoxin system RelE/ParE family toxin [Candidatus Methylomirabilis sp.]
MRSGEPFAIVLAPSAHRLYKKFDPALQEQIKAEARKVARSPYTASSLHSPFQDLRSHHFHFRKVEYRIAYRIREDKRQVEIVLVKSRERFYEVLARLIRQR